MNGTSNGTSNVFQILGDIQQQLQSQYNSSPIPESASPFRTTTSSTQAPTMMTAKQANPVHVNALPMQNTSWSGPPAPHAHVHNPPPQVLKPRDLLALRKVQHPHNGRTSVNRLPFCHTILVALKVQDVFQGNHTNFTLNLNTCLQDMPQGKLQSALRILSKRKVELGILEEVKEHTDWVNSYVIVEKDSGNHHAPKPHY